MASACESSRVLTLLTLPKEVRLRIYDYIFIDSEFFLDRQFRHGKPWSLRYDQEVCMFRKADLNVLPLLPHDLGRSHAINPNRKTQTMLWRYRNPPYRLPPLLPFALRSRSARPPRQAPHHYMSESELCQGYHSLLLTPYLESIEWHAPRRYSPPSVNDYLPSGATILRSVVLGTQVWEGHRLSVWGERAYDVKLTESARPLRIIVKPC